MPCQQCRHERFIAQIAHLVCLSNDPKTLREASQCPCWRVYLDWWTAGQDKRRPGVYYHGRDKDDQGGDVRTDEWLCGPLILEATTFDRRNESFGRLSRGAGHLPPLTARSTGGYP